MGYSVWHLFPHNFRELTLKPFFVECHLQLTHQVLLLSWYVLKPIFAVHFYLQIQLNPSCVHAVWKTHYLWTLRFSIIRLGTDFTNLKVMFTVFNHDVISCSRSAMRLSSVVLETQSLSSSELPKTLFDKTRRFLVRSGLNIVSLWNLGRVTFDA